MTDKYYEFYLLAAIGESVVERERAVWVWADAQPERKETGPEWEEYKFNDIKLGVLMDRYMGAERTERGEANAWKRKYEQEVSSPLRTKTKHHRMMFHVALNGLIKEYLECPLEYSKEDIAADLADKMREINQEIKDGQD